MAIHEVEGPDGQIHQIEAPEDATEQEVVAFAQQSIQAPQEPREPMGQGEALGKSAIKGVPFGNDIASGIAALYMKTMGGIPLADGYNMARQSFHEDQAQARQEYPKTAAGGEIGGAIGSGFMLPASALRAPTLAQTAIKGGLVGGAYGSAYGFDEGDSLGERSGNAIQQGVVSAPMGAGVSVAADLALRGVAAAGRQYLGPLSKKVAEHINRRKQSAGTSGNIGVSGQGNANNTIGTIQQPLQRPVQPDLSGGPIPLTKGNLTQDPKLQALEYGATAGNYGDEAQRMMLESREIQSNAAKGALSKMAGTDLATDTGQAAARDIRNTLSEAYKTAKTNTRQAYKTVGEMQEDAPLKIGADYIRETVVPSLQQWARKGSTGTGFDLRAQGMENAKRLYNEGVAISQMKKINSVNFDRMEQWRGRVSQGIRSAKDKLQPGVKDSPETVFLQGMLERFDDAMNALPKEAIKNGDEGIIDALTQARAARSKQGTLFERNKIVMDVLKNDDITNESLVNILFSGKGKAYNAESASNLQKIITAAGDKGADVLKASKSGVYAKILRNSLDAREIKSGAAVDEMVSFDKLATNLKELVNDNPSLFKMLHPDPAEQAMVRQVMEAAQRIKSHKPGTKNYSNSAYTMLNWVRAISPAAERTGFGGANLGAALKALGEGGAITDLNMSLAPVLKDTAKQLDGPAYKFFQRYAPGAATAAAANQSARITVAPAEGMTPLSQEQFQSGEQFQ